MNIEINKWGEHKNLVRIADHYAVVLLLQKTIATLERENAELRARVEELEIICSESYQVVGNLSCEHKVFCHKKTTKALDNLSQQKRVHHDVLPYQSASFEKDAALKPKAQEGEMSRADEFFSDAPSPDDAPPRKKATQMSADLIKRLRDALYAMQQSALQDKCGLKICDDAIAEADAHLAKMEGYVLVPVEPTDAMISAGEYVGDYPWTEPKSLRVYKAMITEADAHLSSVGQSREDMPDFMPVDTAPKDGTMLRLFVRFNECSLEDGDHPQWTMGFNDKRSTEIDEWHIVGWSWTHDCFVEAHNAQILGWLPFIRAVPDTPSAALKPKAQEGK